LTKHTIRFLAATPVGTDRIALDREARAIQVELERCLSMLGAQLLPVTNVIAARLVRPAAMALWVDMFYKRLASGSIAAAFKLASGRQPGPDVALRPSKRRS
jgi:hypothetical protein